MSAQRVYIPFNMFGVRIVNMQYLWNPSLEYLGKKQEKPSWFHTCITPKTRAAWWEEPSLAANWAAYSELLQKSGMTPQHISEWPIKDGDMPSEPGKTPAEWAKGHWVFGGSTSSNPIKVEMVQAGNCVPLPARLGVKPGDYVALGMTAAFKQNNPRSMKHFCNTVLFTGPGEEIAVGSSVSGAELMAHAQQQGLQVAGFSGSPGFGGGQGFMQPGGGFAPAPGSPAAPPYGAPGPGGPGFGGNAIFPSNGAPQGPGAAPFGAGSMGGPVQPMGPGGFAPPPGTPATAYPSNQPAPQGPYGQPGPQFPAGPYGQR